MPVYTYRCESCGVTFERHQKFADQPLTRCPECGKKALKKVYTPVGIVFKGSGFYATDHHSPSGQARANASKDEGKDESKNESKDESKDAAPAKKAEKNE